MKPFLTFIFALALIVPALAQKISAMPSASSLTGSELVPVVQGGVTSQATTAQLKTYADSGLTITTTTGTLTIGNGKTLTASNTITLTGTDGSTLNIGGGGALGSAAFTSSSAYDASGAAATAQSTAEAYAANSSNQSSGTVNIARLPVGNDSSHVAPGSGSTVYAPLASPGLTGTPTAPTASSATSTTQIATTAFAQSLFAGAIPISGSDAITGTIGSGAGWHLDTSGDLTLNGSLDNSGDSVLGGAVNFGDVINDADGNLWANPQTRIVYDQYNEPAFSTVSDSWNTDYLTTLISDPDYGYVAVNGNLIVRDSIMLQSFDGSTLGQLNSDGSGNLGTGIVVNSDGSGSLGTGNILFYFGGNGSLGQGAITFDQNGNLASTFYDGWAFNADGSGYLSQNSINFDGSGNLTAASFNGSFYGDASNVSGYADNFDVGYADHASGCDIGFAFNDSTGSAGSPGQVFANDPSSGASVWTTAQGTSVYTPSTGGTVTGTGTIIDELIELEPTGTLATLTLNLEANDVVPVGWVKEIACSHSVTALTLNASGAGGGTINGTAVTSLAANVPIAFKKTASKTWRRLY